MVRFDLTHSAVIGITASKQLYTFKFTLLNHHTFRCTHLVNELNKKMIVFLRMTANPTDNGQ